MKLVKLDQRLYVYSVISTQPPQIAAHSPVRQKVALAVVVFMCFEKKISKMKKIKVSFFFI